MKVLSIGKFNGYIGNRVTKKNKVSPTIVGRRRYRRPCYHSTSNGKRRLTVGNSKITSSPDDMFLWTGWLGYRQIGNAWPVAYTLGKMLKIIS